MKKLIATYFGGVKDNLGLAAALPVDGLHIDLASAPDQYPLVIDRLPTYKVLSLGLVNGRDAQRCDLDKALQVLGHAAERLGERLWVAPSCSLLHVPMVRKSDAEVEDWLGFAVQQCGEVAMLARAVDQADSDIVQAAMQDGCELQASWVQLPRIHKPQVLERKARRAMVA